ncbi:MAG TPA: hypothetical protein VHG28_07685 [Longimicrobiaceae bacterium]|nr:hypothetical protein [Longimicrobiaceae bacterium]
MQDAAFTWNAELSLMGIPTCFEADHPELREAALAAYGVWPRGEGAGGPGAIRIRLGLGSGEAGEGTPEVRVEGARLVLAGGGMRGEADAGRREAVCIVPPDLLADPHRLAAEVLDTLVLFLLTRTGRVPVHATGVVLGETAVVLAGRSGSGKSTLALTALRAGLPVLSDDTVYVQTEPRLRVWGFPRPIHLLPDAKSVGPDDGGVLRQRGGRWKVAHPAGEWTGEPVADRAVLVLLERGGEVALRRIGAEDAVREVTASLEPGFDHFREQLPAAVRALAAGGAWRLTLSADPGAALAALREALGP